MNPVQHRKPPAERNDRVLTVSKVSKPTTLLPVEHFYPPVLEPSHKRHRNGISVNGTMDTMSERTSNMTILPTSLISPKVLKHKLCIMESALAQYMYMVEIFKSRNTDNCWTCWLCFKVVSVGILVVYVTFDSYN